MSPSIAFTQVPLLVHELSIHATCFSQRRPKKPDIHTQMYSSASWLIHDPPCSHARDPEHRSNLNNEQDKCLLRETS